MDVIWVLREQLRGAYEYLEETLADVTPEMAHRHPPGKAHPSVRITLTWFNRKTRSSAS